MEINIKIKDAKEFKRNQENYGRHGGVHCCAWGDDIEETKDKPKFKNPTPKMPKVQHELPRHWQLIAIIHLCILRGEFAEAKAIILDNRDKIDCLCFCEFSS